MGERMSQCDIEVSQRDIEILPTIVKKSVTSKDDDSIAHVLLRKTGTRIPKPKLKSISIMYQGKQMKTLRKEKKKRGCSILSF